MEGPVSNPIEIQTQINTDNTTSGSRQHTQVDDPYIVERQLDGETGMDLYAGTSLKAINEIFKHECETWSVTALKSGVRIWAL